jgi:hypothetical protein
MTCPIIVEDLDRPRQMLVEVMASLLLIVYGTMMFHQNTINCDDLVPSADALRG